MCVTELMQHAIDQGNLLFADTPYHDSWFIFHDNLSSWWEEGAQAWLEEQGFRDRQVRAWGETNREFYRYHECLVGNSPEMCPLDFHLFEDLEYAILQYIICTSSLPDGHPDKYQGGTPLQLSKTVRAAWKNNPTSARIVEDVTRWPVVLRKIIEANGTFVPDLNMQHHGCSKRKTARSDPVCREPTFVPAPNVLAAMNARNAELRNSHRKAKSR